MLNQPNNKAFAKLHILVVDDDALMQKLVKDVLSMIGFTHVTVVNRADRALDVISKEDVDIIICDWRMPGMSGVEMVREIRKPPITKNTFVNVIMLTGNAEMQNITEARDVGITEYLIKPFTVKDLCAKIIAIVDHPREFVISDKYTGPSRRRKTADIPEGVERRQDRFNTEDK